MKLLILAALVFAPAAYAKGKTGTPQTHHCMVNGAEVSKTKKECKKAGGMWEKGAPTAALAAEITRANIIVNGTDVEGVYTQDPKKNPRAKLIRSIHVDKLLDWAMTGSANAGRYELLDPLALKILQRAKIPTRFVSLANPENIIQALRGKDIGTRVTYS